MKQSRVSRGAEPATQDLPTYSFDSADAFERWLEKHHTDSKGIWLTFAKKGSGVPSVSYPQAVEVALCYGWIDGQLKPVDAKFYRQRFCPRRARSIWSKRNIERVERLMAAGRMRPAGLVQIEAAKSDGRWSQAYDPPSTSRVPADFQCALDEHPKAKTFFGTLNRTNTYAILFRIQTARKPETRAARIQHFVQMLNRGETIHPFSSPKKTQSDGPQKRRKTAS